MHIVNASDFEALAPPSKPDTLLAPADDTLFFSGDIVTKSHLNLLFRQYSERFNINEVGRRDAWIQSLQADFVSGFTGGPVGLGVDISPYAAIKLNGGNGARNLVHFTSDGGGQDQRAWAYFGKYVVKAEAAGVIFKYGLQALSNPLLSPYDIRALPPTFRGWSLVTAPKAGLALQAGSFDAVNARGDTSLRPLTTTEGGTRIRRFDYAGGDWNYSSASRVTFYANRASDIWNQYYLSATHGAGDPATLKMSVAADMYATRSEGRRLQGDIDNKAYSLAFTGQHAGSSFMVGYQRMIGEDFFDYVQETNGIYLSNSVGVDYNTPNERSLHFQYKFNGAVFGNPGFQLLAWKVRGWGMDATAGATEYAEPTSLLHNMYWKNGMPIQGGHSEIGLKLTQSVQDGTLKNAKAALVFIHHKIDPYYPGRGFLDIRLMIDFPFQVF